MVADSLYPFQSRHFARGPHRLHYLDEGSGPPVVMLHGNPTWSFYFRNLIQALRAQYRCIAVDHLGCGLSDKPPLGEYPYRLINRVQDVEALLEHVGVESGATFVVHDWGGMIGGAVAVRKPERVGRWVVLNTAAFGLPAGKRFPRSLHFGRNTALGRWSILHANAFCRGAAKWCVVRKPLDKEVRHAYLAPYDSVANRVAVLRFVEDIPLSGGDPSYALVDRTARGMEVFRDAPMFVGWGAKDFVFDDDFLAEWRRRFPHAEVHRLADAGHYVLEDAGDELIPKIAEFLRRTTPVAVR